MVTYPLPQYFWVNQIKMCDRMSSRGRPESVSDAELIKQARAIPDPCFTAKEVAEGVNIGVERVRQRLRGLEEGEVVNSKTVGSGRIYWLTGI
jgi:hypothetical protein